MVNGNLGGFVILFRRKKVVVEKLVLVGIYCESGGGGVNDVLSFLIILFLIKFLIKIKIEYFTVYNDLLVYRLDFRLDGYF